MFKIAIYYEVNILDKTHFVGEIYDCILGYCVVGLGGFLLNIERKPTHRIDNFWFGYLIAISLRFIEGVYNCSYFYNETVWCSIQYCMGYIGIEAIVTILILLIPKVREAIGYAMDLTNRQMERWLFF